MQEDKENSQWADILHEEDIEVEKASGQSSPVGELVAHYLMRDEPADEDASQEAHDRQENLSGDEVKPVEQRLAEEVQTLDGP